jgi:hypothetical protein
VFVLVLSAFPAEWERFFTKLTWQKRQQDQDVIVNTRSLELPARSQTTDIYGLATLAAIP